MHSPIRQGSSDTVFQHDGVNIYLKQRYNFSSRIFSRDAAQVWALVQSPLSPPPCKLHGRWLQAQLGHQADCAYRAQWRKTERQTAGAACGHHLEPK
jgi:hypothetical protein